MDPKENISLVGESTVVQTNNPTISSKWSLVNSFVSKSNGIEQLTDAWHIARSSTVGGSSLATIQGINPYANIYTFVSERLRPVSTESNTAMRWGNLFEQVIKEATEKLFACEIIGENIFIEGSGGTSFSPDGLTIINDKITLVEFKCPFTRIPTAKPPKYYIPQVKMGLDMIKITEQGLLIEAVFRRVVYNQLKWDPTTDCILSPKPQSANPIAIGFIGVYSAKPVIVKNYNFVTGTATNKWRSIDLGGVDKPVFDEILQSIVNKTLNVYYHPINWEIDSAVSIKPFTDFCAANNFVNYGIIPWKLFNVVHHFIEKEAGYIDPWRGKILEITNFIKKCKSADPACRQNMIDSYMAEQGFGFTE